MYNSTGKTKPRLSVFSRRLILIVSFVAVALAILAFFQWVEIQNLIQSQTQFRNIMVQAEERRGGARVKIEIKGQGQAVSESKAEVEVDILKLEMADPLLFTEIRNKYLVVPSSEPYKLKEPLKIEYPQYKGILKILYDLFPMTTTTSENQGQRQSFFIEAGAFDGETFSNTLNLERDGNWTGLLVEPNPESFNELKSKNRKAWLLNSCLSPSTKPINLTLEFNKKSPMLSRIQDRDNKRFGAWQTSTAFKQTMTCLPIFSILSAINVSTVDFFSLDVEGAEVDVLKTIPFDKIYIKVFLIEGWSKENFQKDLIKFMEGKKYIRKQFPPSRENFLYLHPKFISEKNE